MARLGAMRRALRPSTLFGACGARADRSKICYCIQVMTATNTYYMGRSGMGIAAGDLGDKCSGEGRAAHICSYSYSESKSECDSISAATNLTPRGVRNASGGVSAASSGATPPLKKQVFSSPSNGIETVLNNDTGEGARRWRRNERWTLTC